MATAGLSFQRKGPAGLAWSRPSIVTVLWAADPRNRFRSTGSAKVRNVELPASYSHVFSPQLTHLLKNQEAMDWINHYEQTETPKHPMELKGDTRNILFGADIWQSMKKHWVIELQRLIRARRARG